MIVYKICVHFNKLLNCESALILSSSFLSMFTCAVLKRKLNHLVQMSVLLNFQTLPGPTEIGFFEF